MSLGGIAALIIAVAILILVISIVRSLNKVPKILNDIQETVQRVNTTIDVVTKDVDGLSIEVEALLNKTNRLMDDVNGKLGKTDPLFSAIGEIGETVSEINDSAKDTATHFISGIGRKRPSKAQRITRGAKHLTKAKNFLVPKKETTAVKEFVEEPETPNMQSHAMSELEKELIALANRQQSTTAGEIMINHKGVDNNEEETK